MIFWCAFPFFYFSCRNSCDYIKITYIIHNDSTSTDNRSSTDCNTLQNCRANAQKSVIFNYYRFKYAKKIRTIYIMTSCNDIHIMRY